MEEKNFKKKKSNCKKSKNINNTMRIIKDYYSFVSDKGYDANNICCLLDYEKYLYHK